MRKQNWLPGLVISLGIALITISTRLVKMEKLDLGLLSSGVLYNFLFCLIIWSIYFQIFHRWKLVSERTPGWLLVAALMTALAILAFPYDYLFSLISDKFPIGEAGGAKRAYILLVRGLLISGLFYFISYYLHLLSEKQKARIEVEQLKQAQLAANLFSLKEQLSPHFLFNTLNTLSSMTREENVKHYVAELANVYRYVLQYKEQNTATLEQELAFIQSYLYILKARMEDSIHVEVDVTPELLSAPIPPLTLQLLIENAVKHNVSSSKKQLRIRIENEGRQYLTVMNNFQPRSSVRHSTGTGLSNVMQRYRLLFNREIRIEKTASLFKVSLPIV